MHKLWLEERSHEVCPRRPACTAFALHLHASCIRLLLTSRPLCAPALNNAQEELEQWATAAKQKEDDSLALERYRRQDEAKVKELSMQLERAQREAHQAKRDLEDEVTATQVGAGVG